MQVPKDYILTSKTIERLKKEADEVRKKQLKIKQLRNQLYDIYNENSWTRYLSAESYSNLTDEEYSEFIKASNTINSIT